jgi:hypothetical protein
MEQYNNKNRHWELELFQPRMGILNDSLKVCKYEHLALP